MVTNASRCYVIRRPTLPILLIIKPQVFGGGGGEGKDFYIFTLIQRNLNASFRRVREFVKRDYYFAVSVRPSACINSVST